MQEAFQYGYESVYRTDKEQVLLDEDIDENLKELNSYACEMVVGVIVTINQNSHNHLDLKGNEIKVIEDF